MKHTRRIIKRLIITAVLCLLSGAIITIAVTWACVLTIEEAPEDGRTITHGWLPRKDQSTGVITISIVTEWRFRTKYVLQAKTYVTPGANLPSDGGDAVRQLIHSIPIWSRGYFEDFLNSGHEKTGESLTLEARGWPCVAMWSGPAKPRTATGQNEIPFGGIPVVESGANAKSRALPMIPVWSGFAINSGLFGGSLFTLFVLFAGVRRGARRLRGRCPRCGYALKNVDGGCPECGHGRDA